MDAIYKVVGNFNGRLTGKILSREVLVDLFKVTGAHYSPRTRAELQGQPILSGMCGPMFDGEWDGRPVIRYESGDANRILSI